MRAQGNGEISQRLNAEYIFLVGRRYAEGPTNEAMRLTVETP